MKLVLHNGEYRVIDRARRLVRLSKYLDHPSSIFTAYWITQEKDSIIDECVPLTEEANSFKQLKHYVAYYILHNKLPFSVPESYKKAYKRYVKLNREDMK